MKKSANSHAPLYISANEVCKIIKIKPHILDYWEKKIPEIKAKKIGRRKFYKKEDLEFLLKIKKMLEEGYSLKGINKKLKEFSYQKERTPTSTSCETPLFPELLKTSPKRKKSSLKEEPSSEHLKNLLQEVLKELKEIYQRL